jgi:hypothetical protein
MGFELGADLARVQYATSRWLRSSAPATCSGYAMRPDYWPGRFLPSRVPPGADDCIGDISIAPAAGVALCVCHEWDCQLARLAGHSVVAIGVIRSNSAQVVKAIVARRPSSRGSGVGARRDAQGVQSRVVVTDSSVPSATDGAVPYNA